MVAVANLIPSKPTDDPSRYPWWIFVCGAVAALPLVAYRALLSPTIAKIERVLIIASSLTVLLFFVLFMGIWHLVGSTPSEASPGAWALFYGLSAGWVALAVATRLKLRT